MSRRYVQFMKRSVLIAIPAVLILLLLLARSGPSPASAAQANVAKGADVAPDVLQAVAERGQARVLITLTSPPAFPPNRAQIAAQQQDLISRLPEGAFALIHRYETLPALAGILNEQGIAALESDENVALVQLDMISSGHLGQSVDAIEANVVHAQYGLMGAGKRVAVLDTGIDTDHPDLASSIVAQRCFTDGDCTPHGGDVGDSAEDEHGHGTNVSGIITADGHVSSRGFAPAAGIVAIRVLNQDNWGWLSDWVAGLDWILANQTALQVDVVNMSLGTVALYEGNCDDEWPIVANAVAQLRQTGVPVFASSGNQGAVFEMGSPACNRDVIAVGATYDGNLGRQPDSGTYKTRFGGYWPDCYDAATNLQMMTCFTNGGEMLDLLAPGMWITAPGMGGGLSTYAGTSQASPTAASIAALLLQADETLTPAQLETILRVSGTKLVDPKNGYTVSAINARQAIQAVGLGALEPASWLPVVSRD